jgi:hypothetical protein
LETKGVTGDQGIRQRKEKREKRKEKREEGKGERGKGKGTILFTHYHFIPGTNTTTPLAPQGKSGPCGPLGREKSGCRAG